MDLFSPVLQLVNDAEGGIRYWPDVIPAELAQAWFEALHDGIAWRQMSRPMYDRVVEVPRLLASWRLASAPAGLPLPELLAHVQGVAPAPYNAVGLNLYRDGRDSVAMHNDKLHTLIPGHPITLVSLGAPRQMNIRARADALRAEGRDPVALAQAVSAAPHARDVLRRFVRHAYTVRGRAGTVPGGR